MYLGTLYARGIKTSVCDFNLIKFRELFPTTKQEKEYQQRWCYCGSISGGNKRQLIGETGWQEGDGSQQKYKKGYI